MRSWTLVLAAFFLPAPAASECLDYAPAFEYLGNLPPAGAPHAVAVSGDLAFVGTDSAGVQVVDASDPATPQILATITRTGRTRGVSVSGHLLAMAGVSGLDLADISDPAAPQLLGSFATGALDTGSPLLVTTAVSGTRFYDLSSPRFPALLGSIVGGAQDVEVQGDYAYFAVGSGLSSTWWTYRTPTPRP